MRRILLAVVLSLFILAPLWAQALDTDLPHPVYDFLARQYSIGNLKEYDDFHRPLQREYIAAKLQELLKIAATLSHTDLGYVHQYLLDFQPETLDTLTNSVNLTGDGKYTFDTDKSRYFAYSFMKGKGNVFVNVIGQLKAISNDRDVAMLGIAGGSVEGTINNQFGFYLYGSNGKAFGNKTAAYLEPALKYNYKFNEANAETFFDDTRGYITFKNDYLKLKLGRDLQEMGFGIIHPLLDQNHPMFDYFSLSFRYSFIKWDFFHGKLLTKEKTTVDSLAGEITTVTEKYLAHHRVQFTLSDASKLGAGEYIVYANRPMDLSYVNPVIFFKSIEHSNRDRDNAMLFFDFSTRFASSEFKLLLLIDDIDYSKLFTGWYGDQTIWHAEFSYYGLNTILPLDIHLDYLQIQPYVFSHRIQDNNFSTYGYLIGYPVQPNSVLGALKLVYHPNRYLVCNLSGIFGVHGKNEVDAQGNITRNFGGDFRTGYRTGDNITVHLLDGVRENMYQVSFQTRLEYIKDIVFYFNLNRGNLDFTLPVLTEQTRLEFSTTVKF